MDRGSQFPHDERKGNFMKEQVLAKVNAIINTLDTVSVSGRANWDRMRGSVAVLEEVAKILNTCDILPIESNTEAG